MSSFIQTVQNIFKIEELRNRIGITLLILLVVRIGANIPLPGIDVNVVANAAQQGGGGDLFALFDLFVGGALSNASIFALGIMPYITMSIILQMGGVVVPQIQKLQKEGEEGRRKINQYTRIGTVFISMMNAVGIIIKIQNDFGAGLVPDSGFLFTVTGVLLLTMGVVFMMWLGEQITENGIGNGISLIIMINIIARLPQAIRDEVATGSQPWIVYLILGAILVAVIAAVVLVTQGARRIPVQYAKRQVGRKVYGGQTSYLPLRVNSAGVMPIIFAQAIIFIPATISSFFPEQAWLRNFASMFTEQSFVYAFVYGGIIIFFTYFYTAIVFNPKEIADNMKRNGGFIPGIRPGKQTAEYIDTVLTRITLPGSIFLALVAIMPVFISNVMNVRTALYTFFGGTSILIIVGVALDTLQQIESYLLMRRYDGFMKSGKIRGRAGRMM